MLPNANQAVIDERKVRDYLLNPFHARGRHKARTFAAALGYRRADYMHLIDQIRTGILRHPAVAIDPVPHGRRFWVEMPIAGPAGTAIVRTLWIIRTNEDVPRFTSAYPIR